MDAPTISRELELDIIFGRLKPRERLVEEDLATRFAAKRHVVRTALNELEKLGIVVRRPHRGAQVRDYTADEVEELYNLRAALHELAVNAMPLPAAPGVLARLKDIQGMHAEAVAQGNLQAVFEFNNQFHDTLFATCGNRYLADAIRQHAWLSHAIRSYRMAEPSLLAQAREEHEAMIHALERGDRERLRDLCGRHIEPSKRAYLLSQGFAT